VSAVRSLTSQNSVTYIQEHASQWDDMDVNQQLHQVNTIMKKSAESSLGLVSNNKVYKHGYSSDVEKLAAEKRKLRLDLTRSAYV